MKFEMCSTWDYVEILINLAYQGEPTHSKPGQIRMNFRDIQPGPAFPTIRLMLEMMSGIGASNAYGTFMLDHGCHFKATPLRPDIRKGQMKACFSTSQRLITASRNTEDALIYVEGYAVSRTTPIAIHHAWVVDRDGMVIDPTWSDPQDCTYFGVPFSRDYVRACVLQSKKIVSLLDNYEDRWALLQGGVDLDYALYQSPQPTTTLALT
jgi:hypothetical protein